MSNSLELHCEKAGEIRPFFVVRPAGRTHQEVKVLYSPDKGKS
jgi:hypothetical protein